MTVNFRMDVNAFPRKREYTVKDIARIMGTSERRAEKRVKSFVRHYGVPYDQVMKLRDGRYRYVLTEDLVQKLLEYYRPKIRIEVRVE